MTGSSDTAESGSEPTAPTVTVERIDDDVTSYFMACVNFPDDLKFVSGMHADEATASAEAERVRLALAPLGEVDGLEGAGEVREEWAAWEDTHTSDPNDEAARIRPVRDRADAEDYVTMPKARRRRIARRLVTRSSWAALDEDVD